MTHQPLQGRSWAFVVAGAIAAMVTAACITLTGPTILHGRQIAGTPTASAADVTAVKAERKANAELAAKANAAADLARLEAGVRQSMQDQFDNSVNDLGAHINVIAVHLVKTGDNKYEGMATMSADGGPQRDIAIHVTADERNTIWNIDAGGLLPLFH